MGLVKRRLKDAGLPERLSPHSFRGTPNRVPFDGSCENAS